MLKKTREIIKDFRDLPNLMKEATERFIEEPSKPLTLPERLKAVH